MVKQLVPAVLLALVPAALASAQDPSTPEQEPTGAASVDRYKTEVLLFGEHRFESEIEGGGEFTRSSLYAGFFLEGDPAAGTPLSVAARYRYDTYDFGEFEGVARLYPTEPWETIQTYGGGIELRSGGDIQFWAGGVFDVSSEDAEFDSEAFVYGGFVGASWAPDPDVRVGGGFGVISDVGDTRWYPVVDVRWWLGDDFRLQTRSTIFAYTDLSLELIWELTPQWETGAGIAYQDQRFLLSTIDDAVGRDRSIPIWWHLAYNQSDMLQAFLRVGFFWMGELRVENVGRDTEDYGAEFLIAAGLSLEF